MAMTHKGEISFDAVEVEDDDDHIEGCYRLAGTAWKIFYMSHRDSGELWDGAPIVRDVVWPSGIPGMDGLYPTSERLNKSSIKRLLSEFLRCEVEWTEVRGPDSLQMK